MTLDAQTLQVRVVVGATLVQWLDVIEFDCSLDPAGDGAVRTQWIGSKQESATPLERCRSVALEPLHCSARNAKRPKPEGFDRLFRRRMYLRHTQIRITDARRSSLMIRILSGRACNCNGFVIHAGNSVAGHIAGLVHQLGQRAMPNTEPVSAHVA